MAELEYTANLLDAEQIYAVYGGTREPRVERRRRAFERMIREIQDAAYEEGQNDALAFGRDGY